MVTDAPPDDGVVILPFLYVPGVGISIAADTADKKYYLYRGSEGTLKIALQPPTTLPINHPEAEELFDDLRKVLHRFYVVRNVLPTLVHAIYLVEPNPNIAATLKNFDFYAH